MKYFYPQCWTRLLISLLSSIRIRDLISKTLNICIGLYGAFLKVIKSYQCRYIDYFLPSDKYEIFHIEHQLLFLSLRLCLCLPLNVCIFVCLSVPLSLCLPFCLSVFLSVSLSVCLSARAPLKHSLILLFKIFLFFGKF